MKEGNVVLGGLVPAHQNTPKPVQPTVGAFHHPAPRLEPGCPLDRLCLLAPTSDVGGEAKLCQRAANLAIVVALVQAHAMGSLRTRRRSRYRHTVQGRPHQLHVMTVSPVHCQTHRNPRGFGQQVALDPALASVGGIGAGFFPRPGAIWSPPRPSPANCSPAPAIHRTVPDPPRPRSIPESADGPWSRNRCRWHPGLSTDSQCAARRRCRRRRCGRELGAGPAQGMGIHMLGNQGRQHFPKLVGNPESAGGGIGSVGWAVPLRPGRRGIIRFGHSSTIAATRSICLFPIMRVFIGF